MSAVMRILGWKAEGLRCPDHELNCTDKDGKPYPVSLVQMPNGTGKTTTLALLRAALSGTAIEQSWDRDTIAEFRKRNGEQPNGVFEIRLLLNERRATIAMEFDFENGRVLYKTTYGSGHRDGFNPPPGFKRFMNENFVNFYVFDGELAQHLLDREYADAHVVMENLFQMNVFDAMARRVSDYWDSKTQNVGATETQGLSRRRNHLARLKERCEALKHAREKLRQERSELDLKLQRKEKNYHQGIEREDAKAKSLNDAEAKAERLKMKVREEALDVLELMRNPHALSPLYANWMLEFKNGLDKVRLPESAAREFFVDLARESECVCGRLIDADIADTIRMRAEQYLGSDDVSLLNSMKTAMKDFVGDSPDDRAKELDVQMASLSSVVEDERDARNDLDERRLDAEQSDPALKSARDDIENLRRQLEKKDEILEGFESKDQTQTDERTFGIEILEKRITDADKKLAEITHTLVEKAKRDTLTAIIKSAHKKAHHRIAAELCDQANSRIFELMPENGISIDRIERNLILKGQRGGSVGETLSIAYAFLATLFHRSDHQLPFVVDSPAGPIDLAVRPRIGELIPNLSGQFIAFTISSERAQFIEPLKRASNAEIQFVTLFRKGSVDLMQVAYERGAVVETVDGLNVEGEDFFSEFQLEEEEAA